MISIREVARLAGVSPATVSRVLNGTAKVDRDKEERIRKVIRETGYVPNEVARSLFRKSSKLIGLIVPNIENPFFSQLAKSLEQAAYTRGYRIVLCNTDNVYHKEVNSLQMLTRMNADGVIITTTDEKLHLEAEKCAIPVVVMDRKLSTNRELAYVSADHYEGGRLAAQHLVDCGCKNIVNMRANLSYSSARDRYRGYLDVIHKYRLPEKNIDCSYNYEAGLSSAQEMLKMFSEIDGVIASNDVVAIATMKVLAAQGYRVPEDIQVIGYDDIDLSRMFWPEISTIRQPLSEMAEQAIELICQQATGVTTESRVHMLPVRLVERGTTKKL